MTGHTPWSEIKHKVLKQKDRCSKLNIDNTVCGKVVGTCIHKFHPTLFGQRPQRERQNA